jgi:hypothetical protein
VYESEREDWPYSVDISLEINVPPSSGVLIEEICTPERDLFAAICAQHSYINLKQREYDLAEAKLREAASRHVSHSTEGNVPESALVEAAENLFLALDAEEAAHAKR